jgi:spore germination cell wall hydrolase CwlJ-like protein
MRNIFALALIFMFLGSHAQSQQVLHVNYRAYESFKNNLPLNIPEAHKLSYSDKKTLKCLAWNLYFEARGGSMNEKIAIAYVPINRSSSNKFSTNICDNVFQVAKSNGRNIWQFSWAGKKLGNKFKLEQDSWVQSQQIALQVMNQSVKDYGKGSLYFYHKKSNNKLVPCPVKIELGSHIFCAQSR